MVMPRSRSSGALSIESNARNCTLGLCLESTLVIAAVKVVLPWSTWPIVPMLQCGLLRSNFAFAIVCLSRLLLAAFAVQTHFRARHRRRIGAGEGNRTLVISLEGCCSTIELHPPYSNAFASALSFIT